MVARSSAAADIEKALMRRMQREQVGCHLGSRPVQPAAEDRWTASSRILKCWRLRRPGRMVKAVRETLNADLPCL